MMQGAAKDNPLRNSVRRYRCINDARHSAFDGPVKRNSPNSVRCPMCGRPADPIEGKYVWKGK